MPDGDSLCQRRHDRQRHSRADTITPVLLHHHINTTLAAQRIVTIAPSKPVRFQ